MQPSTTSTTSTTPPVPATDAPAESVTLYGTLKTQTFVRYPPFAPCAGIGAYAGFHDGAPITITSGSMTASGVLANCFTIAGNSCMSAAPDACRGGNGGDAKLKFNFAVAGVPADATDLIINVAGNSIRMSVTSDQLSNPFVGIEVLIP